MSSLGVEIADEIVSILEDATLSVPIVVQRAYIVPVDLSELTGVRISVIPLMLTVHPADLKPRHLYEWGIQLIIRSKVEAGTSAVDPLMGLVEEIVDLFVARPLLNPSTRCVGVENQPVFNGAQLDMSGLFESVLLLTIRSTR